MKTKNMFKSKLGVALTALLCTTLWGTAFPVIKVGYQMFNIYEGDIGSKLLFAGLRFSLAGVLVLIISLFLNKSLPKIKKPDLFPILILGVVQTTLQYVFSYIGVANTTSTKTSVLSASSAFIAVIMAPLFFKNDKINIRKIFGCVIGIGGIVLISFSGLDIGTFSLLGEGFVLISAVCATFGSFLGKAYAQNRDPVKLTGFQLFIGGIILVIVGIIMGGKLNFLNIGCYLLLIYLAIISAIAFTLWTALLKYNPASEICVYNLLIPIFGTIWSGILLGEDIINVTSLVSTLLVCSGIFIVNYTKRKSR